MKTKLQALKTVLAAAVVSVGCSQAAAESPRRLGEVTVTARRPMKEIGVTATALDSAALKENIARSMADVLASASSVFVKNYGRATLSTVSFRGTSPSHTRVTWNGMKISSPMLGMTDFSTIPAYFIDSASLLHGSSSVTESGGGFGGMVRLSTLPDAPEGWAMQYVQGIGSFKTFDEFLRVSYANDRWTVSTRAACATSPNDYPYINRDKKVNVYDDEKNIVASYHPREKNRSGSYRDVNVLQEVWYDSPGGDRGGLSVWYADSNRELPLLTTDYGADYSFDNRQRERTLRSVATWGHKRTSWSVTTRAGYIHSWTAYDYSRELGGGGGRATMTRSRSTVNTLYGEGSGSWLSRSKRWLVSASMSAHHHWVSSNDLNIANVATDAAATAGYHKRRLELSASASVKWQPTDRLGLSAVVRQESAGDRWAPLIPALFADWLISRRGNVTARASISRNYRFPSLNDLYFLPGGNPSLKNERGWGYDCGVGFETGAAGVVALTGNVGWFDSYIDDWILWLPTPKGFFSPRNVKSVHAYGIESSATMALMMPRGWKLDLHGSLSWTPSINCGEKMSDADRSIGRQLPYVPKISASASGRLSWRGWSLLYSWLSYSRRYTMSSNETSISGHLPAYYMNNLTLGKSLALRWAGIDLKLAVNNLFDEEYLSVLSHPMPGINFEFFIGISPKW